MKWYRCCSTWIISYQQLKTLNAEQLIFEAAVEYSTPVCISAPKNTWVGAKVGSIELWFEKEVAETIDLPMQIEFMI